jgi:hypothetical protein
MVMEAEDSFGVLRQAVISKETMIMAAIVERKINLFIILIIALASRRVLSVCTDIPPTFELSQYRHFSAITHLNDVSLIET